MWNVVHLVRILDGGFHWYGRTRLASSTLWYPWDILGKFVMVIMVMVKFKFSVKRCLGLYLVRILDGGFRWYVRTRVTSSTSRMPSKNFVWNVVYIWFESWTAAFADTFEPDWPPPCLACHSPTYHSSLLYFMLYNHNHDMNDIIKILLYLNVWFVVGLFLRTYQFGFQQYFR